MVKVNVTDSSFTHLLEVYYSMTLSEGDTVAMSWLDEVLRTEEGIESVKELVTQCVAQAKDLLTKDVDIHEYEAAMEERKGKKNEELN